MKKALLKAIALTTVLTQVGATATLAQTNGYGAGEGRTDTINVNDYSTSSWDRFEYNYEFDTGVDYSEELGHPTQTDIVPRNPETENVRRNKDVAFVPPAYGVFSGEIDSERSNPYVTPDSYQYARNTTSALSSTTYDTLSYGVNGVASDTGVLASTSLTSGYTPSTSARGNISTESISNVTVTNTTVTTAQNELNTEAWLYSDGSIGTLSIPKLNVNVKVFEGENLDNLKKGVGHFEYTSAWDGNVCIAGHNGGSAGYFENIKNLNFGDEIIYETKYGRRTYSVVSMETISDSDYSKLGWSNENQLTLITCVKGVSSQRLAVTATEK